MLRDTILQNTIPNKLKIKYECIRSITGTDTYTAIEAKTRNSKAKHTIRVLDRKREFAKSNFENSATLFNQELLRLQCLHPGAVLVNSLVVSEKSSQISCATLPYLPLSTQTEDNLSVIEPKDPKTIEKFISDVILEIEFLWKNLPRRRVVGIIDAKNICFMKDKNVFFVSDWVKIFERGVSDTENKGVEAIEASPRKLKNQDIAAEIKALAIIALKLRNMDETRLKKLDTPAENNDNLLKTVLREYFGDSEKLQDLLEKMLSLDPKNLPNLEELKSKQIMAQQSRDLLRGNAEEMKILSQTSKSPIRETF